MLKFYMAEDNCWVARGEDFAGVPGPGDSRLVIALRKWIDQAKDKSQNTKSDYWRWTRSCQGYIAFENVQCASSFCSDKGKRHCQYQNKSAEMKCAQEKCGNYKTANKQRLVRKRLYQFCKWSIFHLSILGQLMIWSNPFQYKGSLGRL